MNAKKLAENAAAIGACVFEHVGFRAAYERCADHVGGSIGMWTVCAEVSCAFTEAECEFGEGIWDHADWPDTIQSLATLIVVVLCRNGTHARTDWRAMSRMLIANEVRVSIDAKRPMRIRLDISL
jgi:hypothetical protein